MPVVPEVSARVGAAPLGAAAGPAAPGLTPITSAYRSDNAAKPAEKLEQEERRPSDGLPRGIKGFY